MGIEGKEGKGWWHRLLTIIEPQSLVVFGSTALLNSYLCRQNRAIGRIRTYNHTAWASDSGEEKDSFDHSATGHFL